jgi:hypothetical protein
MKMSRMTEQEHKEADGWQSKYQANYEDAKQQMYDMTGCIELEFEHLLPQDTDNVVCEWNDIEFVALKKAELRELVECFIFIDYEDNEIEYNFLDVYNDYLLDAWGVTL